MPAPTVATQEVCSHSGIQRLLWYTLSYFAFDSIGLLRDTLITGNRLNAGTVAMQEVRNKRPYPITTGPKCAWLSMTSLLMESYDLLLAICVAQVALPFLDENCRHLDPGGMIVSPDSP